MVVKLWIFVRNFWQKVIVYMFSLIYICLDFHSKYMFSVKLQCNIDDLKSKISIYFCQWIHYDNIWKIRTRSAWTVSNYPKI